MSMRWTILALAVLAGALVSGCYTTYDPYTGYNKYWPDTNVDYFNDMQPPVDPAPPGDVGPVG